MQNKNRQHPKVIAGTEFFNSDLFKAVQTAGIFPDSKTFADATPKTDLIEIQREFALSQSNADFDLLSFVQSHFELPKSVELQQTNATSSVSEYIEALWSSLLKEPDKDGNDSLLELPKPYLVPGGRFREIYYWDSYFTAVGLMESGREEIVISMIDNFCHLLATVGCIPNGNRSYYHSRSQPPVLAMMVNLITENKSHKDQAALLKQWFPSLEQEYQFWMRGSDQLKKPFTANERVVLMPDGTHLNRYWDEANTPRPESYKEDIMDANALAETQESDFYRNIRAAAESGWDFSSRWLAKPNDLTSIQTTDIIPIDLNALMYQFESLLAQFSITLGMEQKSAFYQNQADKRKEAINAFLWCNKQQSYFDYNIKQNEFSSIKSLASVTPLFVKLANNNQASIIKDSLMNEFLKSGGLITTLNTTSQQWDAPNGWAPLHWFAVVGLRNYGYQVEAQTIIKKWLNTVEIYFAHHHSLMEKYNVVDIRSTASGGEYEVQQGFGWTNGITLKFYELLKRN